MQSLKIKAQAHTAALRHGRPTKKLQVILVTGPDGAFGTVSYLNSILKTAGETVGVMTQNYVEIAGEKVSGSDQADILSDATRLQATLAQMRKAECRWAILEVPSTLPAHQFVGVDLAMLVVRRCGDNYLDQASTAARNAMVQLLLMRKPRLIVINGDDPCKASDMQTPAGEMIMTFGSQPKAECKITSVRMHPQGSLVKLLIDHQTEIALTFEQAGKNAIYSAVAAASAAYLLHMPIESIERGVADLKDDAAFLQFLEVQRPFQVALDSNITPAGIAETLETLKHFAKNRLIVLLSSPLGQSPTWRRTVGETVAGIVDRLVVTDGEYIDHESPLQVREQIMQGVLAAGAGAATTEVSDRQTGIEKVLGIARRDDIVVFLSTNLRPYRQIGDRRVLWSDKSKIEEILE